MSEFEITAISPIDGRYHSKTVVLKEYFSEFGYIKYRVIVELEWLRKALSVPELKLPPLTASAKDHIERIQRTFTIESALRVKEIEAKTNHDVKAIEYYIKECLEENEATLPFKELVHFTCTSEDINNLAQGLSIRDSLNRVIIPRIETFLSNLSTLALQSAETPLLALTHGQPATPTTFGREMAVYIHRLKHQLSILKRIPIRGKFNGATGSFNAHSVAYPSIDWENLSKQFVESSLGLTYQPVSTQIESHDFISELSDTLSRISTILIGFSRDMWMYISRGTLKLRAVSGEVGSSTMPHKVNPIDFENAEGNLGIAIALWHHFSTKLLVSRLQRDLSDSTVLRNFGVSVGHFLISVDSLVKGVGKVAVNESACIDELNENWGVLAEPVQTIMRNAGIDKPYEKLKELTRGHEVGEMDIKIFIETLRGKISDNEMTILETLSPQSYIGLAAVIAKKYGAFP